MARTYVVTGSASGIGATTARLLIERGEKVIGVDLKGSEVEADLSSQEGRVAAAAKITELAGGVVDGVIACAGISAPRSLTMAVNFFGVVNLLQELLPALAKSDAPRVSVVSSMASLQQNSPAIVEAALSGDEALTIALADELAAQGPQIGYGIYPSSKRALSRWVRRASISADYAGNGIALNAVAPGTVITPMTADLLKDAETVKMVDASVPMPLNYHQAPESIAEVLIFLASAANTHMAGQTIYVDGGADASLRGDDIWIWNDAK